MESLRNVRQKRIEICKEYALVVQGLERSSYKREVGGSIPPWRTNNLQRKEDEMKRAIILISIFMIGCQTFDHERMKEVFEQYDIDYTESSETKQDLYYDLLVNAIDSNNQEAVVFLWNRASTEDDPVTEYVLFKRLGMENESKYNKLVHMLRHSEHCAVLEKENEVGDYGSNLGFCF